MSAGLDIAIYKITDRYSANGVGVVLYYYGIFYVLYLDLSS